MLLTYYIYTGRDKDSVVKLFQVMKGSSICIRKVDLKIFIKDEQLLTHSTLVEFCYKP